VKLNNIYQGDCMDYMKDIPDGFFHLSIVDPPYFDGPQKPGYYSGTKQRCEMGNQIIWGINYFNISLPGGRIIWIKGESETSPFSMADIAYNSFYNRIDVYKYTWAGFWQEKGAKREKRIHPTQKPVALYKWLLRNYAKEGDKILDTHLGSASSIIACIDMGFDFMGIELDEEYYAKALQRVNNHLRQGDLTRDQKFENLQL
jgi:site-specific DNA-methyltransferase (adenine-specific)